MRTIERSAAFRRDYKRLLTSPRGSDLKGSLNEILANLAADAPLAERYRDHKLRGPWSGYRECHVKPDVVLIYQKISGAILRLVRLGTHADLFRR